LILHRCVWMRLSRFQAKKQGGQCPAGTGRMAELI
jgi:hypothetical protein